MMQHNIIEQVNLYIYMYIYIYIYIFVYICIFMNDQANST